MELNEIHERSQEGKILIIDARGGSDYMASHIPASVSVPFSPYSWARAIRNWLNGQSPEIVLVAPNADTGSRGAQELASVGLKVVHVFQDGLDTWKSSGLAVASVEEITPEDLSSRLDEY
ncbi:MAG: rhodanese-like domain-containing protein, partial [Candidatus Thermoplasmatota archaeon]|nr:rhodanese-like domain-containing protein [Candidatus Thermoplasmatota archaeon]